MTLPAGVPNLFSLIDIAAFPAAVTLLTVDGFIDFSLVTPSTWGLYLNGTPIVNADTVTAFSYRQEWAVADYPVERGGFESYDKVNTPFRVHLQFVSGGSEANRQALLDSIIAIADTLTLFDAVTPEEVYIGVNIERYEYRRTAVNGLGLLTVDMDVLEIREDGVTQGFQNPISPSGFQPAPTGNVSPTDVSSTQSLPAAGNLT